MRPSLDRLAARLPPRPRTRFAPSPTGVLHLGHIVNAVYVWGLARALGGVVVLRVEDHDRERARGEFERAMLDDLDWLGLQPDEGDPQQLRAGPSAHRQGDREGLYRRALERLRSSGLVYACRCSRSRIEQAGGSQGGELRYPGTCRDAGHPWQGGLGLRVRLEPRLERFDDGLLGSVEQVPAEQCGDLLVRDRVGHWTYQFAVTVDDLEQRIDLVIRGRDLLSSTGRQLQLARLLGRDSPPVYLHHPLVLAPGGAKLSKSNRDAGVNELRAAGRTAADVLGLAAAAAGLIDEPRQIEAGELAGLFEQ